MKPSIAIPEAPPEYRDKFRTAYYGTPGMLNPENCSVTIAEALSSYHSTIDLTYISQIAVRSMLLAPAPDIKNGYDPVHHSAVKTLAHAVKLSFPIGIWTVGDTEPFHLRAGGRSKRETNNQAHKIITSRALREIRNELNINQIPDLHFDTSASSKDDAAHNLIGILAKRGVRHFHIPDDLEKNEAKAHAAADKLSKEFPDIKLYTWVVKGREDPHGNINAWSARTIDALNEHAANHEKAAVLSDFDETLMDTQATLNRTADLMLHFLESTR